MAYLDSKFLFFTTSPRTPEKMIPEISLLIEEFNGRIWDTKTQTEFYNSLLQSDFFEGAGGSKDKALSARDRITRAPKSLGFVDVSHTIALTEAGKELIYGTRPQEVFLRQLLKFQLPSPYHRESPSIKGNLYIRPYLEILRLIRELEYLTFDELKVFAMQLTDYRKFNLIKKKILNFRQAILAKKISYNKLLDEIWTKSILHAYSKTIKEGKTKTRETGDASLQKFVITKKNNHRDYADACFRYLRYTGLVAIEHQNRIIKFYPEKINQIDFILKTAERAPVFVDDKIQYTKHLFSATEPVLYDDKKENIVNSIIQTGYFTEELIENMTINELKDIRDHIISDRKYNLISSQVKKIKSYSLYSEIMAMFNDIISNDIYDAPLMLEYNTWRAMTMLNGGKIKGNFRLDDFGAPLSTAQGNMPDIECDYGDFVLAVEVTMQNGQRQYESEGEPVARHYGQIKQRTGKTTYCLFIAPKINPAALVHFWNLNQINNFYYGGKTQIIPLDLSQFMKLLMNSYNYKNHPQSKDVRLFLDSAIAKIAESKDENAWRVKIQEVIDLWPIS